jgi:hypothetical protein
MFAPHADSVATNVGVIGNLFLIASLGNCLIVAAATASNLRTSGIGRTVLQLALHLAVFRTVQQFL